MRPIVLLSVKDLRLLARDRVAFFFTCVFPLIFGVLFGLIFSGAGGAGDAPRGQTELLYVDLDQTALSRALVEELARLEGFELVESQGEDALADRVRRGQASAGVVIPQGYGAGVESALAGDGARLRLFVDPSRRAETAAVEGQLRGLAPAAFGHVLADDASRERLIASTRASLERAEGMGVGQRAMLGQVLAVLDSDSIQPNQSGGGMLEMFAVDTVSAADVRAGGTGEDERAPRFQNAFELTMPQGVAWGLMGCVLGFGLSFVHEANQGTLVRLLAAPLAGWQVLAGKGLACFVAAVLVQVVLYAVSVAFLGVRPDSWLMLVLAWLTSAWAFTGMMLLLATLGRTTGGAEGLGRAVLLTLALLGGAGVPLFFLSGWMQTAAGLSPFKWLILAHEGAIWRDASFVEMLVPCGVLVVIGAVGGVAAALRFPAISRSGG